MSLSEVCPEQFARLFHRYQQALACDFPADHASAEPCWQDLPEIERERLVSAARLTLLELEIFPPKEPVEDERRRWFAKAGHAEWGC